MSSSKPSEFAAARRGVLQVDRLPSEYPESTLDELTGGPVPTRDDGAAGGRPWVALTGDLHDALVRELPLAADVEDGGFLAGQVYTDRYRPGVHLVRAVRAIPAVEIKASAIDLVFSGDSFTEANREIDCLGGPMRMVGWYHTHLFAADDKFGLSTLDLDLHSRTFLQPWHLAALLNVTAEGRHLRVYGWHRRRLEMLPYRVGGRWTP